jgi:uncharacterized membrane protein
MKSSNELFELLKQRELIDNIDLRDSQDLVSPWYIKILMGCCGWLATIFTLGFLALGIESLFDSSIALTVLGVLMIGVSFTILSSSKSDFIEHVGLAVSFAGQALVVFAMFVHNESMELFFWAVLTLMCCSLSFLMPSYIHRVMSAYLATVCLSFFMFEAQLSSFFSSIVLFFVALMWLYEFTFSQQVQKLQSVAYGTVVGLLQFKTSILFAQHGQTWAHESLPNVNQWIDEGFNVLVLVFILYTLIKHKKLVVEPSQKWLGIAVVVLLSIGTFYANGIVSGIVIIVLGFAIQNKILLALGVISAILNLSSYYYFLDISLLNKSFILGGLGGTSLILAYLSKHISDKRKHHES